MMAMAQTWVIPKNGTVDWLSVVSRTRRRLPVSWEFIASMIMTNTLQLINWSPYSKYREVDVATS